MDVIEEGPSIYDEPDEDKEDKESNDMKENVQVQNPLANNLKARKPAPLQILNRVKMNNTLATPRSTIKGFLNVPKQTELKFNRENLKKVEDQLKRAFVEFYQKLRLLKSFRYEHCSLY